MKECMTNTPDNQKLRIIYNFYFILSVLGVHAGPLHNQLTFSKIVCSGSKGHVGGQVHVQLLARGGRLLEQGLNIAFFEIFHALMNFF